MKLRFHCLFLFFFVPFFASSLSVADSSSGGWPVQFSVKATTEAPLWLGAEAELVLYKHYSLDFGYGYMPTPYTNIVAGMVGSSSGNNGYQTLVNSMLQQNSALKFTGEYRFGDEAGWLIGGGAYIFNASGDAPIVEVLQALTGQTYTNLINILNAQGKSLTVHTQSTINLGEIHFGYAWRIGSSLMIRTSLGVAKILSSSIALSSNAPNFDNSVVGQNAYANSESSLQNSLATYGITPVLEASLGYSF